MEKRRKIAAGVLAGIAVLVGVYQLIACLLEFVPGMRDTNEIMLEIVLLTLPLLWLAICVLLFLSVFFKATALRSVSYSIWAAYYILAEVGFVIEIFTSEFTGYAIGDAICNLAAVIIPVLLLVRMKKFRLRDLIVIIVCLAVMVVWTLSIVTVGAIAPMAVAGCLLNMNQSKGE